MTIIYSKMSDLLDFTLNESYVGLAQNEIFHKQIQLVGNFKSQGSLSLITDYLNTVDEMLSYRLDSSNKIQSKTEKLKYIEKILQSEAIISYLLKIESNTTAELTLMSEVLHVFTYNTYLITPKNKFGASMYTRTLDKKLDNALTNELLNKSELRASFIKIRDYMYTPEELSVTFPIKGSVSEQAITAELLKFLDKISELEIIHMLDS